MNRSHPASTAKIGGHPIHPMLVPFPIAFLVSVFLCDLAYLFTLNAAWATASQWLLGAGIVMALVAALAGFTDFFANEAVRTLRHAWEHMIGNLVAVVLAIINLFLRVGNPSEAIAPWGVVLSFVVVSILLFTGWRGGDLVYSHRVGVKPPT